MSLLDLQYLLETLYRPLYRPSQSKVVFLY